jgi:DNA-binding NarL/FixJ family response regulator
VIVAATTTDLMDRSRIGSSIPGVRFTLDTAADVVIVDLGRGAAQVAEIRGAMPTARIVCYGPHVDGDAADAARAAGADVVMPRSRFFRDPAAAIEASAP